MQLKFKLDVTKGRLAYIQTKTPEAFTTLKEIYTALNAYIIKHKITPDVYKIGNPPYGNDISAQEAKINWLRGRLSSFIGVLPSKIIESINVKIAVEESKRQQLLNRQSDWKEENKVALDFMRDEVDFIERVYRAFMHATIVSRGNAEQELAKREARTSRCVFSQKARVGIMFEKARRAKKLGDAAYCCFMFRLLLIEYKTRHTLDSNEIRDVLERIKAHEDSSAV